MTSLPILSPASRRSASQPKAAAAWMGTVAKVTAIVVVTAGLLIALATILNNEGSAFNPPGLYGSKDAVNQDRDPELTRKWGEFRRISGTGSFTALCASIGRQCRSVVDWQGVGGLPCRC